MWEYAKDAIKNVVKKSESVRHLVFRTEVEILMTDPTTETEEVE